MSSVNLMVRTTGRGQVRAVVGIGEALSNPIYSDYHTVDNLVGHTKIKVDGLQPDTKYHVGFEVNGTLNTPRGVFDTLPTSAHSFSFAFGSCWNGTRPDDRATFNNILSKRESGEVDFFFHLGDIHYADIVINETYLFHEQITFLKTNDSRGKILHKMPCYYMWDDHDYGPDNSSSDSPSREAALRFFRSTIPVTCASSVASDGVYYSFVRGRVRFIVTDVRSERTPNGRGDSPVIPPEERYVMSAKQTQWFKDECLAAQSAGHAIIWANTYPWVSSNTDSHTSDDWGGFHIYRQELADWITANNLNNRIAIISGDMHALAYDDGTSANNRANLKVCHAAPLDTLNSQKGGPYSHGPITATRTQYGLMDIIDTGSGDITCRFRGISVSESSGTETVGIDQTFTLDA